MVTNANKPVLDAWYDDKAYGVRLMCVQNDSTEMYALHIQHCCDGRRRLTLPGSAAIYRYQDLHDLGTVFRRQVIIARS